jgi:hypothetical protein
MCPMAAALRDHIIVHSKAYVIRAGEFLAA